MHILSTPNTILYKAIIENSYGNITRNANPPMPQTVPAQPQVDLQICYILIALELYF